MAKPNYRQAKRQKELARKARQEEKMQRRSERTRAPGEEGQQNSNPDAPAAEPHD